MVLSLIKSLTTVVQASLWTNHVTFSLFMGGSLGDPRDALLAKWLKAKPVPKAPRSHMETLDPRDPLLTVDEEMQ